ncbi:MULTISPECIES: hypothetical protein [Streptomyces]|uniref:hypothetical protein n=1 Tax=Streptomyces TaxID=1883 RepID=UPI0012FEDACB|nr:MULTISPECIES: hypothetical protein [Streptomyces]
MSWTTALAVFGASTGAFGVAWQVWSHWLTGGRVQVLALRGHRSDDRWEISTSVVNIGRQDVTVHGYTVWLDLDGMLWKRLRWKARMLFKVGLAQVRSTLVTLPPSFNVSGNGWLRDGNGGIQFPVVVRAGSTLRLPSILLGWESDARCRPRVAIHLGSGKLVQAEARPADVFEPLDVTSQFRIVAYMEVDTRSDELAGRPEGSNGGPTRVTTSVRSRGNNRVDSVIHIDEPSDPV